MRALRRTAGIWGPAAFAVAAVFAARRQPAYSHRSHHVSGLAASGASSAVVMLPGFLALGASGLMAEAPDPAVTRLVRAAGATTVLAGSIRVSDVSCPQPGRDPGATTADVGHGVASVATFVLWTVAPLVARRGAGPQWYRGASGALAGPILAGFVAAGATTLTRSRNTGIAQRAFLGSVFAWQVATAVAAWSFAGGPSAPG